MARRRTGIGRKIADLRFERALTQSDLSNLSGVNEITISNIEGGKRQPAARTLRRLAAAFGVDVRELTEESGTRTNVQSQPLSQENERRGEASVKGVGLEELHRLGIPTNASEVSVLNQCINPDAPLVEDEPVEWERIGWLLAFVLAEGVLTKDETETAREAARRWLVEEAPERFEESATAGIGRPRHREDVQPLVEPRRIGRPEPSSPLSEEVAGGLREREHQPERKIAPLRQPKGVPERTSEAVPNNYLDRPDEEEYDEFTSGVTAYLLELAKEGKAVPLDPPSGAPHGDDWPPSEAAEIFWNRLTDLLDRGEFDLADEFYEEVYSRLREHYRRQDRNRERPPGERRAASRSE